MTIESGSGRGKNRKKARKCGEMEKRKKAEVKISKI